MKQGWVNAAITVLIPLDVPVTATKWEKQEASGAAVDRLIDALPADMQYVMSARWEDMTGYGLGEGATG